MAISARYRQLLVSVEERADRLYEQLPETSTKSLLLVDRAAEELQDRAETVGEIPQLKLHDQLAPVLLKAHGHLDRARLQLEEAGHQTAGTQLWELEQMIYHLLNDL